MHRVAGAGVSAGAGPLQRSGTDASAKGSVRRPPTCWIGYTAEGEEEGGGEGAPSTLCAELSCIRVESPRSPILMSATLPLMKILSHLRSR